MVGCGDHPPAKQLISLHATSRAFACSDPRASFTSLMPPHTGHTAVMGRLPRPALAMLLLSFFAFPCPIFLRCPPLWFIFLLAVPETGLKPQAQHFMYPPPPTAIQDP